MTTYRERTHQATLLGTDRDVRRYDDIRQMLPDVDQPTPLVRLNRIALDRDIYLKLEWLNPFGSVKDRAASYLLEGLARRGLLRGKKLVEASSGNTAIALAALAALEGISITITIPVGVPQEKKVMLRMLGAEVWETPDDLCPVDNPRDGAIALARSIAGSLGGESFLWPDQYSNPDNVRAHYETTGPEIWSQTEGRVRTFVAGYGTCGTLTGVGRFLKEMDRNVRIVAVEPQKGHRLPGLKSFAEAREPEILDRSIIDQEVRIDDDLAYAMTKRLYREEGLIVGPSTGAIVAAASGLAEPGLTVGISPDSGFKYASFFVDHLGDEGLPQL